MNDNKISKELDLTHDYFKNKKVSLIKNGHNRTVYYLVNNKNEKHVAKKGHPVKDSGSTNLNDIISQNFINYMGYSFVPKIISYDSEHDLHVESYVGEKNMPFEDLSKQQLDTFAKQLAIVHNLPIDEYYKFCLDRGFDEPKITSPIDGIKLYGFDRFEIVKKLCPDKYVIKWIDSHLKDNLKNVNNNPKSEPHLKWGDIGENIRTDESGLYFIDWEFSELGFGTELAYIKIHSHISPEKFAYLVDRYAKHSHKKIKDIYESIEQEEKITRVNDVVWAAMKWGQSKSSEDIEKYKSLTYKRIELAENI